MESEDEELQVLLERGALDQLLSVGIEFDDVFNSRYCPVEQDLSSSSITVVPASVFVQSN